MSIWTCEERRTDDIDELFSWESAHWDFEYRQLTRGRLGYQSRTICLGSVAMSWHSYGQRVLCRDAFMDEELVLSMVIAADRPPRFAGRDVQPNSVLVHHRGKEKEYVIEPGTTSLDIVVSSKRLASLEWELSSELLRTVPQKAVTRVIEHCRQIQQLATLPAEMRGPASELHERRMLELLYALVQPARQAEAAADWRSSPLHRSFRLVQRAQMLMARRGCDEKVSVAEIARGLGVSERTLYNAFRDWLGVGPYEYDLIQRLHLFRNKLRRGRTYPGKVTRAALDTGFSHLGQLGRLYRRHFGETPTQTIKQADLSSRSRC